MTKAERRRVKIENEHNFSLHTLTEVINNLFSNNSDIK